MGLVIINDAKTQNVTIAIDIPGTMKGSFIGKAIIRSKEDNAKILERAQELGTGIESDSALIREMYDSFTGLPVDSDDVEEGFKFVLHSKWSSFLIPAVADAYYEQYGKARAGNSRTQRGR